MVGAMVGPLTHATIWKAIKATPEIGLSITHTTNDCVGEIPTIETPTSELNICNFIHISWSCFAWVLKMYLCKNCVVQLNLLSVLFTTWCKRQQHYNMLQNSRFLPCSSWHQKNGCMCLVNGLMGLTTILGGFPLE
jgi:hypothetical protein